MRPLKDLYWIKIGIETENSISLGGTKIYLDSSYDPMRHTRQYGIVEETPVLDSLELDIEVGDKIWFHHFVADDSNKVDIHPSDDIYQAHSNQIYARERAGKMSTVGSWNLIEQKVNKGTESTSGLTLNDKGDDVVLQGKAVYLSLGIASQGVKGDDDVIFSKDSEYDMDINGVSLLRMRDNDILAIYE
tara:strand:- start:9053 stop:9619 length:567 start_codon:yes stop_codon:yes gene_type:complete